MMNITSFVIAIGIVSMIWRVAIKYELPEKIQSFLNKRFPSIPIELCVMCVTFWVSLGIFQALNLLGLDGTNLFYNILRAFSATPFVIELTRKEWT